MHHYFKASLTFLFFHLPFFFLLLIPENTSLTQLTWKDFHYEFVSKMPVINYYNKPHDWTVAVIKPDGMKHQKEILSIIQDNGFKIIRDKILHISRVQVREWYADKQNEPYYPDLEAYLTRDKIRVLQLERPEAIESLRHLIGPTDPKKAQKLAPKSIRALYGTNIHENAIHASDSKISAEKEFSLLF